MLGTKVRISEHNTKGNKNFLDKKDHLLCKVAKEIKKMSTYTEKLNFRELKWKLKWRKTRKQEDKETRRML